MHICITKILHTKLFIWDFRSMLAFLVIFQGWLREVQKHTCISCHDSGMTYIKLSSFVKINNFYFTNIWTAMMCDRYIMWLTWISTLFSNLLLGKGRPKFVNERRDIKCHQCITKEAAGSGLNKVTQIRCWDFSSTKKVMSHELSFNL